MILQPAKMYAQETETYATHADFDMRLSLHAEKRDHRHRKPSVI